MNTSWSKWCILSITKHFDDNRGTLVMFLEGTPRDTNLVTSCFELRIDGPSFIEPSKDFWKALVDVNILVQYRMTPTTNFATIYEYVGQILVIMDQGIPLLKLGTGAGDTGDQISCLELQMDPVGRRGDLLTVTNYGQVKPGLDVIQLTIEGHYEAQLSS